uniref:Uncharacterized protein AlNc14C139G7192 n=1 Tax=Albugo laibachii Nc14 TaxID=890382 RepID=F0WL02_9STRA|nr:conserved hypothetical protein [Albugo laibachii Nc14]|eukprot:CCA21961.1 conserved hypothetical protein [Albugo laibachii Nc14]
MCGSPTVAYMEGRNDDRIREIIGSYIEGHTKEERVEYVTEIVKDFLDECAKHGDDRSIQVDPQGFRAQLTELLEDIDWIQDVPEAVMKIEKYLTQTVKREDATALQKIQAQFPLSAKCQAVLEEDQEWHQASIIEHDDSMGMDSVRIKVIFDEYGKKQWVEKSQIVLEHDFATSDDWLQGRLCAMCDRPMNLSKHHLIPRVMHTKYLKKGYTKDILNMCIMICRPCHNKIHSVEDEKTLATDYNTLDKIMKHPDIVAWVNYARKQKTRIKPSSNKRVWK